MEEFIGVCKTTTRQQTGNEEATETEAWWNENQQEFDIDWCGSDSLPSIVEELMEHESKSQSRVVTQFTGGVEHLQIAKSSVSNCSAAKLVSGDNSKEENVGGGGADTATFSLPSSNLVPRRSFRSKENELPAFSCATCGVVYTTTYSLREHINSKPGHEAYINRLFYDCPYCKKGLEKLQHLREHIWICHPEMKKPQCAICKVPFISLSCLLRHMKKFHN